MNMPTPLVPVDWSKITPHLPRAWRKVGKPFPIPGGVLFIVAQPTGYGTMHAIMQYNIDQDRILGFEPDGKTQAQYATNAKAREAIARWARILIDQHEYAKANPSPTHDECEHCGGQDSHHTVECFTGEPEPTDARQDDMVDRA